MGTRLRTKKESPDMPGKNKEENIPLVSSPLSEAKHGPSINYIQDEGVIAFAAKHQKKIVITVVCSILAAVVITTVLVLTRKSSSTPTQTYLWWQYGSIYQIYPRSFQDSNNDGTGDLKGITSRLDYITSIGVEAIWLSPIFVSPMADYGYDIANFTDIDPIFGTLADFDELMDKCKSLGIRVILDLVPNHSSDEHPWFKESRSSRDNPKRDWYIWHDGITLENGTRVPPNDWVSNFDGSAWEYDNLTDQFYYHAFLKEQPDFNYRNPDVLQAMEDIMTFWLDRGVDGFRVDAFPFLFEDTQLRNDPPNPNPPVNASQYDSLLHTYTFDLDEVHDVARSFRKVLDRYNQKFMVGECYLPLDKLMLYYGTPEEPEFHMPFNFLLLQLFRLPSGFNAGSVKKIVSDYMSALPANAWANWVLGNHDNPRMVSQLKNDIPAAELANLLLLTLEGTPTTYYGDEIAMHDISVARNKCKDPAANVCRDPERSPMQWDSTVNAGFTSPTATPWLPLPNDSVTVNVKTQSANASSPFVRYQKIMQLRNAKSPLNVGVMHFLDTSDPNVLAFSRSFDGNTFFVIFNIQNTQTTTSVTVDNESEAVVAFDSLDINDAGTGVDLNALVLAPWQGLILEP